MKLGLRLQIVLLLGGLLVCAFVPFFYALATYTQVALRQVRLEHARELGRALAGRVAEERRERTTRELVELLNSGAVAQGAEAIGVHGPKGEVVAAVGSRELVDQVAMRLPTRDGVVELELGSGTMLAVVLSGSEGAVSAIFRVDEEAARAAPLLRLIGLYAGVVALATLLLAYFALTRLIVRPLDALTRAARRVADGSRSLTVPTSGAFELVELGSSLRSMTERLLAEEQALRRKVTEVEEATKELKAAQDSLVRSERLASVGRLSAGLAHEVGNPLAALIGLEDLLLAGDLSPQEQRDFLMRMRKETERIHRIVRDLLEFARPNARSDSVFEPGDLALAIQETTTLLRPQKAFTDVELELEIDEPLPKLGLQTAELVQIVLNLLLNAADACGPGGRVVLRVTKSDDGVRLEVEDTGPGVSAEVASQLFEPFVTTKEVGAGTGLGLAVCRGLVESVGGSIVLDSSFTDGARFVVRLPAVSLPPRNR